ncbi:hypothetical protein ACFL1V_05025 [Pseudomonadota bacterium]
MSTYLAMLFVSIASTLYFISLATAEEISTATFGELDSEVGCSSKLNLRKKNDLFNTKYLGRRMTWEGVVFAADSVSVSVDVDGRRFEDLSARFLNANNTAELIRDQPIRLSFTMESPGTCYRPFSGRDAVILK